MLIENSNVHIFVPVLKTKNCLSFSHLDQRQRLPPSLQRTIWPTEKFKWFCSSFQNGGLESFKGGFKYII